MLININSRIYKNPYGLKDFLKMAETINNICHENFDVYQLCILKSELESIDNEYNEKDKLFNRHTRVKLTNRMKKYSKISPCAEIFYMSIFRELLNKHKNEPIHELIRYINKLTLMSKNGAITTKY